MERSNFPSIISFSPNLAVTGVTTTPSLIAKFNMEMEETQFSSLTSLVMLIAESDQSAIPLSFVSYGRKVLELAPTDPLTPNETYQITFNRGIRSIEGRGLQTNFQYVFQVNTYSIDQIELVTPADSTSVSVPNFYWNAVTATTGSVQYKIEIDVNSSFTTVGTRGWTTTTTQVSAALGVELPTRTAYYWRVRAEVVSGAVGPWSDPRSFFYGSFLTASDDTRQVYQQTEPTKILYSGLPDQPSNLSAWPDMTFVFTRALSSGAASLITLTRRSVDGWPNDRETAVAATIAVSGTTLVITPTDTILQNNRYTVTIPSTVTDTNGTPLGVPIKLTFTSTYSPHYCGVDVIQANLGMLLSEVSDDIIHFHIFRCSLDVNRDFLFWGSRVMGGPTEQMVRLMSMPGTMPTYAMEKWVEAKATMHLLTFEMMRVLKDAGKMQRLADYMEQTGADVIREFRALTQRAEQEANIWFPQWSKHWAVPDTSGLGTNRMPRVDRTMDPYRRGL